MLWFVYLNATVPQIAPKTSASSQKETNSFFSIFKRGVGVIANDVKNQIAALKENFEKNFDALKKTIKKTREYSFEGQKNIFNFSEPEPEPQTPLP
jgi:phage regulator Rha-like protein